MSTTLLPAFYDIDFLCKVSEEFGTLGEKKSTQHQQLPTTIPYPHLKSISYSPDVGTLERSSLLCLSQTSVNKPAKPPPC